MILILPGMLRSEFLYSRLLLVYCGEESAGYVVKTEKTGGVRRKNSGISAKSWEKIRILLSSKICTFAHVTSVFCNKQSKKEAEILQEGFSLIFLPRKTFTGQQ